MHHSSYTREIGMDSEIRTVPLPVAWAVFAVLAAIVWFGGRSLQARVDARLAAERTEVAPAKPAHSSLARR